MVCKALMSQQIIQLTAASVIFHTSHGFRDLRCQVGALLAILPAIDKRTKIHWLEVAALQHLCQIPKTYQLACAIISDEVANIQKSNFLATKSRSEEVTACLQLVKFSS